MRGSRAGLAITRSSRTVVMSSGESRATASWHHEGTRARVIELWGRPFGDTSVETAKNVDQFTLGIQQNYGHAGLRFVQHVLARGNEWDGWRDILRQTVQRYKAEAGGNAVLGRLATYAAAINTAAQLAHEILGLPWACPDVMSVMRDAVVSGAEDADQTEAALRFIYAYANANERAFYGREERERIPVGDGQWMDGEPRRVNGGYLGRWDRDDDKHDWLYISFFPYQLERAPESEGFDPCAVIELWAEQGQLMVNSGRTRHKVRVPCDTSGDVLISIRREALQPGWSRTPVRRSAGEE
jgi:hypothetical protein